MLRRCLVAASVGWALALPAATFVVARPLPAFYACAFVMYAVGGFVCHQLPERSFQLWAVQMPVCARCTGVYVGAAIAVVLVRRDRSVRLTASAKATAVRRSFMRRRKADATYPMRRARVVLALAAAPTLVSLVYEWTTGVVPGNWIRALAGLPLGAAIITLVRGRESAWIRPTPVPLRRPVR